MAQWRQGFHGDLLMLRDGRFIVLAR